MTYDLAGIDDASMTRTGLLNIPKDLSILNRRGYASTTNKGVPLNFRCRMNFYLHDDLGRTTMTVADDAAALNALATQQAVMKVNGVQNNWVTRNAAVKWHAAREALWKAAGIPKKDIGAWGRQVRYAYDAYDNSWLSPIDGDGAALAGGTWDLTPFVTEDDSEFMLKLVGDGVDEDSSFNANELNFAFSYLSSRATVPADSNLESSDVPATNSKLQQILNWNSGVTRAEMSYIQEDVDNVGDAPPYHAFGSGSTTHDITESVELGRAVVGKGEGFGSVIVDVPFGICDIRTTIDMAGSFTTEPNGLLSVEVLKISEMQG